MSLKKSLAERVTKFSKIPNQYLTNCCISSSLQTRIHQHRGQSNSRPDHPGEPGFFRRLFHKPAIFSPELRRLPTGEGLIDRIRGFDIVKDRIRLDGLNPPPMVNEEVAGEEGLTAEDARKLLKVAQLEGVKLRLREMEKTWISYSEFVQVLKAVGGLIPLPAADPNDPRRKELQGMEKQKGAIDQRARILVRRELWAGLGFLILQTTGFMRLTFWELTWDVMEPICFYLTSFYFMAGYTFFLRTSKEPSFEGFYQSRFFAKQKQLMKLNNFDVERYNELRKLCCPHPSSVEQIQAMTSFDQAGKIC